MALDREKRDVTPITDDKDREVYFAVRKIFSGEDVDEKTYDTTSYTAYDMWAYLFTYGYKNEDDRLNFAIKEAEAVVEMRKKYGLKPGFEPEYWLPKWKFSIPLEDFKKNWPSCTYGRSKSGILCCWDTIGKINYDFLKRMQATPDGWESASHYIVRNMENSMRVKLMMSNERGYRITYHYGIVDCSNVGISNLNILREFLKKVMSDIQRMYPEVVKRSFVVNCGWLFTGCWKIIKNFLHQDTVAKIAVYGSDYKRKLKDQGIVDIPTFVGGTCDDYNLGIDNIYPIGSRILPLEKSKEEESKLPTADRELTLDDDNKTMPKSQLKFEASEIEDSGPSVEEFKTKLQIESTK